MSSERHLLFLAEATERLVSTLDVEAVLGEVMRLAVPALADVSGAHLLDEAGRARTVAVAHRDPEQVTVIGELEQRYPRSPGGPGGLPEVLRTGRTQCVPHITPELLAATARDAAHLRLLQVLAPRALLVVALKARGRVLGTLSLMQADSGRTFTAEDVRLVEELARRVSLSLDNALLYREAREAQQRAEQLQSLSARLAGAARAEQVADALLDVGLRAVGAKQATVALVEGDRYAALRVFGYDARTETAFRSGPVADVPPVADCCARRQSLWWGSLDEYARAYPTVAEHARSNGAGARAILPLVSGERPLGFVWLTWDAPRTFTPGERAHIEALVRQCTPALERARLHDALRESELRLEAFFEHSPVTLFLKDRAGHHLLANRELVRLTGLTREALLGKRDEDLFPPEHARVMREHDLEVLATDAPLSREEVASDASGAERTFLSVKFPLHNAQGQPYAVGGIASDITVQKRIEDELRESEARFRMLAETVPQIVWIATPNAQVEYLSPQWYAFTGMTPGESLGMGWADAFHPDDQARVWEAWIASVRANASYEQECRYRRADGTWRWMLMRATPEHGGGGAHRRWYGTSTDITERKLAEEFHEQLISIVGHDVRSPLSAITMSARQLGGLVTDPRAKRVVQRVERGAWRIDQIIRLLVDFTRARLGSGIPVVRRDTDVCELLSRVTDEFRAAKPGRTVQVDCLPPLRADLDGERLFQVLANLVENAFKYGRPDAPVTLSARASGPDLELGVHNEGEPIPADLLPRLFQPFSRGVQSDETVKISLGLGLFIVREIVLAHGGRVDVTSVPGTGTTFTVRLPGALGARAFAAAS